MKKLMVFVMMLMTAVLAMAQTTETLTLRPVKKGEEPKQVMDAIRADFPQAIVKDLSFLPGKLYGEMWSVTLTGDRESDLPDVYQVTLKDGHETYRAVYNNQGKLVSSKTVITSAQLPEAVVKSISTAYPGWKIVQDREKIQYKNGNLKEAFRVMLQENKKVKHVFVDGGGNILKERAG
ncbi:hypothetical protein KK083_10460 [Fulvivirgaceae bacterium PWU4]|uniref:Beta-lactamase-inhibitor-like PepSY-like domain-containing protein n=1 Tax=Chryseosolibacter histidini TaxID=2782349 RepID=A0AAP2GNX4_9BACT|nr:hypothetical protein [Chryseosolibacter histidini]MBT1697300.1 hypothetical protein [Chryseosolibacter histidini]